MIRQLKEQKYIQNLVSKMTLEEKISLCHADSKFTSSGVPRLGIPGLVLSDGPHGVRQELNLHDWSPAGRDDDFSTYLPTGTAMAATWNPELGKLFGRVLGREARARGKDIILGPGFNIIRTPLCGRNFEYYSEDPFLSARIAVPVIQGIQKQDVAACAKHYAANNQELDRGEVDIYMSEQALREIYLPAFEAAVREAGILSVMGAYNKFRGQWCCENATLVNDILKSEWGFEGIYLTDWGAAHSTKNSALNGLDLEMGTAEGYRNYYLADPLLKSVRSGEITESAVNNKAERILRILYRIKKIGAKRRKTGALNHPDHYKAVYSMAKEAAVLLKNDKGLLPFQTGKIKKLAVIGENAVMKHGHGGGSSGVKSFYEINPLEALQQNYGDQMDIHYSLGYSDPLAGPDGGGDSAFSYLCSYDPAGVRAWMGEYYNSPSPEGKPDFYTSGRESDFSKIRMHHSEQLTGHQISARWKGDFTFPESGEYKFTFQVPCSGKVYLNDQIIMTHEDYNKIITLNTGKTYSIQVEVSQASLMSKIHFGISSLKTAGGPEKLIDQAVQLAEQCDAVLIFGGLNHEHDGEGMDRKDLSLPGLQNELIRRIYAVNKQTAVMLISGSPVEMPWINEIPSVLQTWYAGSEAGKVIADIVFGKINPSGKLPFTMPAKLEDSPAHSYGDYSPVKCEYKENLFVGYRHHTTKDIPDLFPFGHGLSYTEFEYSDLQIRQKEDIIFVNLKVKNTGERPGKETVQVYIGLPGKNRPDRELKGFKKILIKPGKIKKTRISIPLSALAQYNEATQNWEIKSGKYPLMIGSSCRDIRLESTLNL